MLPLLAQKEVGVIVLDLTMPHLSGIELLRAINKDHAHIPVVVMTGKNEVAIIVECMKVGAFDYLAKPVERERFISSVKKAMELRSLQHELTTLREYFFDDQMKHGGAFSLIITRSKKIRAIFQYMEAIALSRRPVLITGETGVGKELIAKAIHNLSGLKGSFITVNVAGLDDSVFSDTLFGHKKGAFTGAEYPREGLIVQASGGTLFLDEIGDLQGSSQVKLLRLLQEQTYYPLGSDSERQTDARILVATNQDIKELIDTGKFRKDLYYRLRVHHIHIPPLRERLEELPLLLEHFLEEAAKSLNRKKPPYPQELITLLQSYHFPGNVRELQAMVFDAVSRHKAGTLSMESFKEIIKYENLSSPSNLSLPMNPQTPLEINGRFPTLEEVENYLISESMKISKGNQSIAASLLGITRQALNKRLSRNSKFNKESRKA